MHESLQELGLVVEELSAAQSDGAGEVIDREAREAVTCDAESEEAIFDLLLSDSKGAAPTDLDVEQVWRMTLAVDERVLFGVGTQGRRTDLTGARASGGHGGVTGDVGLGTGELQAQDFGLRAQGAGGR